MFSVNRYIAQKPVGEVHIYPVHIEYFTEYTEYVQYRVYIRIKGSP